MTIAESTVAANSTGTGGIGSAGGSGGGISNNGTLTIINGTVSGNTTGNGGDDTAGLGGNGGDGGGVANQGSLLETAALTLLNVTITGNRTGSGGIGVSDGSPGTGGGIAVGLVNSITALTNALVAGNGRGSIANPDDVFGQVDGASAFNLIGDAATSGGLSHGVNGNIVGNGGAGTIDILTVLDPVLSDNGGFTATHLLADGSPAIDAGGDLSAQGVTADQRELARPIDVPTVPDTGDGSAYDMGSVEAGFTPITISGRKFIDLNGDGDDEAGADPGESGVVIFLDADNDGQLDAGEQNTLTLVGGSYSFDNLGPGTYRVREVVPAGFEQTTVNPPDILAASGVNVAGVNFGNFEQITISGRKFNDLNGDGDDEAGADPGLAGIAIFFDDDADGQLDLGEPLTVTLADGSYRFVGVGPGTYRVREVVLAGSVQTTANPALIVAASGQDVTDVDFGNFQLAELQGQKFEDLNANGQRDAGEVGIDGWTIELVDRATGQVVGVQQTTGADRNNDGLIDPATERGRFLFSGIGLGEYLVREVPFAGWEPTLPRPRFSAVSSSPGAGIGATDSIQEDLDADGDSDLVSVADYSGEIVAHFNDGNGGFTAVTLALANRPQSVAAGQLNSDQDVDLVVAAIGGRNDVAAAGNILLVLINDGQGGFLPPRLVRAGDGPVATRIADVDGDQVADLVVVNLRSNDMVLLRNDGTGNFTRFGSLTMDHQPIALATGDVDGDGDIDILSAGFHSGGVVVWRNDGHGNFSPTANLFAGTGVSDVELLLVDGDTRLDLVIATYEGTPAITIHLNQGVAGFGAPIRIPLDDRPRAVAGGDLNGDGFNDIAVATESALVVLYGDPTGQFSRPFEFQAGRGLESVNVGDWDDDQDADLAAADYAGVGLSTLENALGAYAVTVASSGIRRDGLDFGNVRLNARVAPVAPGGEGEYPYHNPSNPSDVSGDGMVSPHDVLLVVNELNARGGRLLVAGEGESSAGQGFQLGRYVDTNRDNYVSPIDVLLVVNALNAAASNGAEGEVAFDRAVLPPDDRWQPADAAEIASRPADYPTEPWWWRGAPMPPPGMLAPGRMHDRAVGVNSGSWEELLEAIAIDTAACTSAVHGS
jgi:hypothetical protein